MSEVKLDETYWKCDVCGERMSAVCDAGFWNIPAERHETTMIKQDTRKSMVDPRLYEFKKKPAVFTICDKCIERLKKVKPLHPNKLSILTDIEGAFTELCDCSVDGTYRQSKFRKALRSMADGTYDSDILSIMREVFENVPSARIKVGMKWLRTKFRRKFWYIG